MIRDIKVNKNGENSKLGDFLIKSIPTLNLRDANRNLSFNKILVNNETTSFDYVLKLNDIISLNISDKFFDIKIDTSFLKAKPEVDVIYEDENILVINKPSGLLSQADKNQKINTIENRSRKYLFDKKQFTLNQYTTFIPTLCNRLDFNTSGLIIIAKNILALRIINEKLANGEIKKYYLCNVKGKMLKSSDTISTYLHKDEKTNKVLIVKNKSKNSIQAITKYKVLKANNSYSLLEVELVTGKSHQIRAHMQYIGHPIIGDKKYNSSKIKANGQELTSYRIIFDFKSDAGILNYLNKKEIVLER